jgi:diguanylate cyclase (GGDEF)-like protein
MCPTPLLPSERDTRAGWALKQLTDRLPVRPGPLLDLMACDGLDPKQVYTLIGRDPAMSARVLGVANSSAHRRGVEIRSIERAVLQMGAGPARTLGLSLGLQGLVEKLGLDPALTRAYWNATLRKAEAARLVAEAIDPSLQASAYSLAVIADVGLPLMMALDPKFYAERLPFRAVTQTWCAAERQQFGIDHPEAGAHALRQWGVPDSICRRVAQHHDLSSDESDAGLILAMFIAGLLPHDDGEMAPDELDKFVALHARVLADRYASPDAFLEQVLTATQRPARRDTARDDGAGLRMQPLLNALTANTIQLVTEIQDVRRRRSRDREDLTDLRFEAFTDPLTKLLNRRGFTTLARQRLSKHPAGLGACCLMLDLNQFKPINDQHGHDAGDRFLRGLAKLLRRSVSRSDLIGRIGGDEFVLLILGVEEHEARTAAGRLRDTCLGKAIRIDAELTLPVSFSLGAVFHEQVGAAVDLDELMRAADALMYRRKRSGEPGLIFAAYEPDPGHAAD